MSAFSQIADNAHASCLYILLVCMAIPYPRTFTLDMVRFAICCMSGSVILNGGYVALLFYRFGFEYFNGFVV